MQDFSRGPSAKFRPKPGQNDERDKPARLTSEAKDGEGEKRGANFQFRGGSGYPWYAFRVCVLAFLIPRFGRARGD